MQIIYIIKNNNKKIKESDLYLREDVVCSKEIGPHGVHVWNTNNVFQL